MSAVERQGREGDGGRKEEGGRLRERMDMRRRHRGGLQTKEELPCS